MHSRIFQLSETPIDEADFLRESYYFDHWFTREIADYVDGDTNRIDDIDWLKCCVNGVEFGSDEHSEFLIVKDREVYFNRAFNEFSHCLNTINNNNTIESFTNGIQAMWSLNNVYEDKFGFSYKVLDHYIRTGECEDPEIKAKIDAMHNRNAFKQQPMPTFDPFG